MHRFAAIVLLMFAACSSGPELDTAGGRAEALASAALKMIRAEHLAMAGERGFTPEAARADSMFLAAVEFDPACVELWVRTGGSSCGRQLEALLAAVAEVGDPSADDDPAAVVQAMLERAPERAGRPDSLLEGYAAAFQLCLEVERDGTLMQDFLPWLLAVGCPLTMQDLGMDTVRAGRLKALAGEMASRTGQMPYPTGQEHYFITFIKLNNWGARFSGQVTADTLAARMLESGGSRRVIGHLKLKGPMTVGFLGDSHMDGIHWSTPAPFPDIVEAVLEQINSRIEVVNAGVGGDDSGEALERIELDLLAHEPDITFVLLGGNDAQHWGGPTPAVTPEQYRRNIVEIVDRLRAAGSRAVLMSYPLGPTREGADLEVFEQMRGALRSVADSLGTSYLDIAEILDREDPSSVFAVDMIHFNPNTHMKVAGMVLARLAAMENPEQWRRMRESSS